MPTDTHGFKEHKKQPFLKALVRFGKVSPAARAVRVSRDWVYDQMRRDATFRQDFQDAKTIFHSTETAKLSEHLDFFCAVVRPVIPQDVWPRVATAVNLALMRHKFKQDGSTNAVVLSRKPLRFPSPRRAQGMATLGIGDGDRCDDQGKHGRPVS